MSDPKLVTRVVLRNYKSIGTCDVRLGPLSILVGPNGCGKSNFVDSLRFIADALRHSLGHALRGRGGINEVRRKSSGHPTHFTIRIEFQLHGGRVGHYAFSIGAKRGAYAVAQEECAIRSTVGNASYKIKNGVLERASFQPVPAIPKDRLFLVNVSGIDAFRPLYDALSSMGFYNLNPDSIREPQPPDPGDLLNRDGSNLSSVLAKMIDQSPEQKCRVEEYLAQVAPGVVAVNPKAAGPREILEFKQAVKGAQYPWRFLATNMSDGTLRALGVLVALFQVPASRDKLIAIEEPDLALHPAAVGVLTDSLRDSSTHSQVLITSHSPDLLDDASIHHSEILAVISQDGNTEIGPLDEAGRSALGDHLYTAGELLRMDQLKPDPQLTLFEPNP